MGRIITQVRVANFLDKDKTIEFSGLVDTGASHLILPLAWKKRLGAFGKTYMEEMETADQSVVTAEICGPFEIQIEACHPISADICFLDMQPSDNKYEPLVGYLVLEASKLIVDMINHELVAVKRFDLK